MAMLTKDLDLYPHVCIASGRDEGEFIDTGIDHIVNPNYDAIHVYLARGYVEQVARDHLGMVGRSEVEKLEKRCEEFKQKLDALTKADEAEREVEEAFAH